MDLPTGTVTKDLLLLSGVSAGRQNTFGLTSILLSSASWMELLVDGFQSFIINVGVDLGGGDI